MPKVANTQGIAGAADEAQPKAPANKNSLVFLLKNLGFISDNLGKLGLVKRGTEDVKSFRQELDQTVEKYIHLLLKEHFFGID